MIGGDLVVSVSKSCCGGGVVSTTTPTLHYPMAACDTRVGSLQRLRARLASCRVPRDSCAPMCEPSCAPAPCTPTSTCGQPLFTGFTTSCADPCQRSGLLARLRERFHGSRSCDVCTVPQVAGPLSRGGCASAPLGCAPTTDVIATPAITPATPDAMPTPVEQREEVPKKEEPKKQISAEAIIVPLPMPTVPISVLR